MQPAPLTGTATFTAGTTVDHNVLQMQPAPLTGTATGRSLKETLHLVSDAARTPHGDSNSAAYLLNNLSMSMQPAPLTGTATSISAYLSMILTSDAARTPHGDEKKGDKKQLCFLSPFLYISACSLTSLFHIDEEGYAVIHSPCAAGFRCVLRGRRQLVYILPLYLSYVK